MRLCAQPWGAGRAKPEVSEQRPHEMTSFRQIHSTGPFAIITVVLSLQSLPTPIRSSGQPDFAYNFESLWIYFIGNWLGPARKSKFGTEIVEFGHNGHACCCQPQLYLKPEVGRRGEDF